MHRPLLILDVMSLVSIGSGRKVAEVSEIRLGLHQRLLIRRPRGCVKEWLLLVMACTGLRGERHILEIVRLKSGLVHSRSPFGRILQVLKKFSAKGTIRCNLISQSLRILGTWDRKSELVRVA